jgi:hypothetical protein
MATRAKLTEEVVGKIGHGEKVYDSEVPGFYALGIKSGVSFRVHADLPTRAQREGEPKVLRRTVGRWPDDVSPKAARTLAGEFIAKIKRGIDPNPKAPLVAPATGWTIQQAWDEYRDSHMKKQNSSPATFAKYTSDFARLPEAWRRRPVREVVVDVAGINELHESVRLAVRAKVRPLTADTGKNSADATMTVLSFLASYTRGRDPSCPAWIPQAVDRHGPRTRDNIGMGLADIGPWWRDVQTVQNKTRVELALFMLLTGLRKGDALNASRQHLDEAAMTLHIPSPKGHKEGHDKSFTLPLTDAAMGCILRARALRYKPTDILFASRSGKPFANDDLERDGRRFTTGHALRHSFKTIAEDIGVPESTIERLLNHSASTQTRRYGNRRKLLGADRDGMEMISAAIMRALSET